MEARPTKDSRAQAAVAAIRRVLPEGVLPSARAAPRLYFRVVSGHRCHRICTLRIAAISGEPIAKTRRRDRGRCPDPPSAYEVDF